MLVREDAWRRGTFDDMACMVPWQFSLLSSNKGKLNPAHLWSCKYPHGE